jgi:hypothetical protein
LDLPNLVGLVGPCWFLQEERFFLFNFSFLPIQGRTSSDGLATAVLAKDEQFQVYSTALEPEKAKTKNNNLRRSWGKMTM